MAHPSIQSIIVSLMMCSSILVSPFKFGAGAALSDHLSTVVTPRLGLSSTKTVNYSTVALPGPVLLHGPRPRPGGPRRLSLITHCHY